MGNLIPPWMVSDMYYNMTMMPSMAKKHESDKAGHAPLIFQPNATGPRN